VGVVDTRPIPARSSARPVAAPEARPASSSGGDRIVYLPQIETKCRRPECGCQQDPAAYARPLPPPPPSSGDFLGGRVAYVLLALTVLIMIVGGILADGR
jgi:hypothetical protein